MRKHPGAKRFSAIALGCALLATSCGSSSKKPSNNATASSAGASATGSNTQFPPIPAGPIKIGLSLSLSGPLAQYGIFAQKAFTQVTLKFFNQMHPDGIDGHPVTLDMQNDAGDATTSVNVINQMIADKVAAVIHVSDIPADEALQMSLLAKAKVPALTFKGDDKYADVTKYPYAFSDLASTAELGDAAAKWIAAHPVYKKIAVLTDNVPAQQQTIDDIITPLKTLAPDVSVVKTVSITPGAVDVSTPLAQLRAANPDLVMLMVSEGFGPIWDGFHAAGWAPTILTSGGFYDGYTSMGDLATKAYTPATDCVLANHAPYSKTVTDLMDGYVAAVGNASPNMLIYIHTDSIQLELLKYAIEKYHSTDPNAIKQALESIHNQSFIDPIFTYNFSPTNHYGITGDLGAHVCVMSPLIDGPYRMPTITS